MPKNNALYVAMRLQLWERCEALTPHPLPVAPMGKSRGFLLVYETLEALHKDWPNSDHITIEKTKGGEHGKTETKRSTSHRGQGRSAHKDTRHRQAGRQIHRDARQAHGDDA